MGNFDYEESIFSDIGFFNWYDEYVFLLRKEINDKGNERVFYELIFYIYMEYYVWKFVLYLKLWVRI